MKRVYLATKIGILKTWISVRLFNSLSQYTMFQGAPRARSAVTAGKRRSAGALLCAIAISLMTGLPSSAKKTDEGGVHPTVPLGDLTARFEYREQNRKYLVHFPPQYDGIKPVPLVLCLHGGGGDIGFAVRMFKMNEKADKEGFIVAYPNGSGRFGDHVLTWNATMCCGYAQAHKIDDVGFIKSFLSTLETEYAVDKKRVYVLGFSNGAMMAYKLATEMPTQFAAVGIVSGSMCGKERQPSTAVPVCIIHGTRDRHIPLKGGGGKLAKWGFNVHAKPLNYAVNFWVKADGCSSKPKVQQIADNVVCKDYAGGKNGSEVELYLIDGYAHAWPGGNRAWLLADTPAPTLSATDTCWDFFAKHVRK